MNVRLIVACILAMVACAGCELRPAVAMIAGWDYMPMVNALADPLLRMGMVTVAAALGCILFALILRRLDREECGMDFADAWRDVLTEALK